MLIVRRVVVVVCVLLLLLVVLSAVVLVDVAAEEVEVKSVKERHAVKKFLLGGEKARGKKANEKKKEDDCGGCQKNNPASYKFVVTVSTREKKNVQYGFQPVIQSTYNGKHDKEGDQSSSSSFRSLKVFIPKAFVDSPGNTVPQRTAASGGAKSYLSFVSASSVPESTMRCGVNLSFEENDKKQPATTSLVHQSYNVTVPVGNETKMVNKGSDRSAENVSEGIKQATKNKGKSQNYQVAETATKESLSTSFTGNAKKESETTVPVNTELTSSFLHIQEDKAADDGFTVPVRCPRVFILFYFFVASCVYVLLLYY